MSSVSSAKPPCIIDIEASGFGPYSYPIEVGVALGSGQKYCSLIQPAADWNHWDCDAEGIHHITRDLLREHGKPIMQVATELNELLEDYTVYTDGWVVDSPWINKMYDTSGLSKHFHVSALDFILTEPQMEIWHETKDEIFMSLKRQRHRASYDAYLIQATWVKTRELTN